MSKLNCNPMLFLDACVSFWYESGRVVIEDIKVSKDEELKRLLNSIVLTPSFSDSIEDILSAFKVREDSRIYKYCCSSNCNVTSVSVSGNVANIVYDNLEFVVKVRKDSEKPLRGYVSISCYVCERNIIDMLKECTYRLRECCQ